MYSVSHSILIIRSEKQYFDVNYEVKYDEPNLTMDIIFTDVDFISIPSKFNNIEIKKIGKKYIFNSNENWYIEAANCVIGKYFGDDENNIWHDNLNYNEVITLK